jgi:hypothetical protein
MTTESAEVYRHHRRRRFQLSGSARNDRSPLVSVGSNDIAISGAALAGKPAAAKINPRMKSGD